MQPYDFKVEPSPICKAYYMWNRADSLVQQKSFLKCFLEVFLYRYFVELCSMHKLRLKEGRQLRARKGSKKSLQNKNSAAYYALNGIIEQCFPKDVSSNPQRHQNDRQKISRLKAPGKDLLEFSQQSGLDLDMWCLLPMNKIKAPLDSTVSISINK